ncbi:virion structural protein [Pectobacterium phage Phoria]|uniref:Uncharacterized protein n=1 Tax=Pectobacterium phage Phoria TaxID=2489634 RepID=A0A3G8FJB5_9CAUD|nr:virion structural protein [Pectobacterium phage Phoria]AZF94914.1 hypothetical protein [Pectobacterium phage Phoria]
MGKFVSKVMKKAVGLEKLTGTYKLTSGIYDKYLGTDIQGNKAAQADAQAREAELNQQALNSQQNANILGVQGTENIAQVEAGGSAADASTLSDTKKKRAGSISSTLGI